jgi:hypothetical protein
MKKLFKQETKSMSTSSVGVGDMNYTAVPFAEHAILASGMAQDTVSCTFTQKQKNI